MKKSVWICLSLILSANYVFGYCYKIDCTGTIQSGKEQSNLEAILLMFWRIGDMML